MFANIRMKHWFAPQKPLKDPEKVTERQKIVSLPRLLVSVLREESAWNQLDPQFVAVSARTKVALWMTFLGIKNPLDSSFVNICYY